MANIITQYYSVPMPGEASITAQNIGWSNPGQVTHRSVYTGDEIIIQRGAGRLFGSMNIGEIGNSIDAMKVEAWISALAAPFAVCEIPIQRESPPNYVNSVRSTSFSNGRLVTQLSSGVGSLRVGHFVRAGNRVLIVSEILAGNRVLFTPQVALAANTVIRHAETVRVKVELSTSAFIPRVPDWYGPWSFNWIEVPDDIEIDTSHFDTSGGSTEGHVDSHSDVDSPEHMDSHLDDSGSGTGTYTDSHVDLSHSDFHSDDVAAVHVDAHSDSTHSDDHSDIASTHLDNHLDQAPGDMDNPPHSDTHNDEIGHGNTHNDGGHIDVHTNISPGDHGDQHLDANHVDTHVDGFETHNDSPSHNDTTTTVVHSDSHSDVPHIDNAGVTPYTDVHFDQNHLDDHTNVPSSVHVDAHNDHSHSDDHDDRPAVHGDNHHDSPEGDMGTPPHDDLHDDAENVAHGNTHNDGGHVDQHTNIPPGIHLDTHADGNHSDSHTDIPRTAEHADITHEDSHSDSTTSMPGTTPTPGGGGTLTLTGGSDGTDAINPDSVNWIDTNVSDWGVTSRITEVRIREVSAGGICIEHTRAGSWPGTQTSGGSNLAGNPWIFANINGTWYAGTYEWLRPGQICKLNVSGGHGLPSQEIRTHVTGSPLNSWTPRSGETVGFMVSTPARFGPEGNLRERSQIVTVVWP